MAQTRKTLSGCDLPPVREMQRLIPTQSKKTLAIWTTDYALAVLLPIWTKHCPGDGRPRDAIDAAREMIEGRIRWNGGLNPKVAGCLEAAKAAEGKTAARTAAMAIARCCSTIHSGCHCIGIALYGALAVAWDRLGEGASWEDLEACASSECERQLALLRSAAVENEPNPANIGRKRNETGRGKP